MPMCVGWCDGPGRVASPPLIQYIMLQQLYRRTSKNSHPKITSNNIVANMSANLQLLDPNFKPPTNTSYSGTFQHAIQVADQIARRYSTSMTWSSWHVWDYFRNKPLESGSPTDVWEAIYPYATCVGFSFGLAADLTATYKETRGLEHFAEEVQVLVSWEKNGTNPDGRLTPRHAVVAICTDEACIVVDLIFSPVAFVILVDSILDTVPYITISGRRGHCRFHYSSTPEGLTLEFENPKGDNSQKYAFRPITHKEAVRRITTYGTTFTVPGTNISDNKIIVARGTVRQEPTKVPNFQLDVGSWMITTCRFQIDFKHRRLTLQMPVEDWLMKERNRRHHWITEHEIFHKLDDAVANLVVEISLDRGDEKTTEHLRILGRIGSCLGLPIAVLDRVVESVHEVWEV